MGNFDHDTWFSIKEEKLGILGHLFPQDIEFFIVINNRSISRRNEMILVIPDLNLAFNFVLIKFAFYLFKVRSVWNQQTHMRESLFSHSRSVIVSNLLETSFEIWVLCDLLYLTLNYMRMTLNASTVMGKVSIIGFLHQLFFFLRQRRNKVIFLHLFLQQLGHFRQFYLLKLSLYYSLAVLTIKFLWRIFLVLIPVEKLSWINWGYSYSCYEKSFYILSVIERQLLLSVAFL